MAPYLFGQFGGICHGQSYYDKNISGTVGAFGTFLQVDVSTAIRLVVAQVDSVFVQLRDFCATQFFTLHAHRQRDN